MRRESFHLVLRGGHSYPTWITKGRSYVIPLILLHFLMNDTSLDCFTWVGPLVPVIVLINSTTVISGKYFSHLYYKIVTPEEGGLVFLDWYSFWSLFCVNILYDTVWTTHEKLWKFRSFSFQTFWQCRFS